MPLLTPFKYNLGYSIGVIKLVFLEEEIHMMELRGSLSREGQGPVSAGDREPQSHGRNEAREEGGKTLSGLSFKGIESARGRSCGLGHQRWSLPRVRKHQKKNNQIETKATHIQCQLAIIPHFLLSLSAIPAFLISSQHKDLSRHLLSLSPY